MAAQVAVLVFNLLLYVLILGVFNQARMKYAGGKVGSMINLIIITVVLLFCSDYVQLLEPYLHENIAFTLRYLLRATALSFLAFGGIRIAGG